MEIPELEEDSNQDQFANSNFLIDQHNTHQESQRIRHEYSTRLQNLSDNKYYTKIDNPSTLQYQIPDSPYDQARHQQALPGSQQADTPGQSTEELR